MTVEKFIKLGILTDNVHIQYKGEDKDILKIIRNYDKVTIDQIPEDIAKLKIYRIYGDAKFRTLIIVE